MRDLQQFISQLESCGELSRISLECDPFLEIAAITDQVCKQPHGGRALLFEHPAGARFPVATNLFGSPARVNLALNINSLETLTHRMSQLLAGLDRPQLDGLDRQIAALPPFSRFAPLTTGAPDDLIALDFPDLGLFPFLHSWPDDGKAAGYGRYITLPQLFSAAPDGSSPNCGMYRLQVRGKDQLAVRWTPGSGAARHLEAFRRTGKKMPVAIALGGDPAAMFSALCPLPGELDEMAFAGFLRGAAMVMTPCRTVPLRVPVGCEAIIEGTVDPAETVVEGPFGNHTGSYSPAGNAALVRVTAVSHRRNAIIPATVVGPPPMEDCWMAKAWERMLLSFLRCLIPEIHELSFPMEWIFHQSAIISLEKPSPGMVRETAQRIWDTPWFMGARILIFIDAETEAAEMHQVAWRCINHSGFGPDSFWDDTGKRLALDATGSRFREPPIIPDKNVQQFVAKRWPLYGFPFKKK